MQERRKEDLEKIKALEEEIQRKKASFFAVAVCAHAPSLLMKNCSQSTGTNDLAKIRFLEAEIEDKKASLL